MPIQSQKLYSFVVPVAAVATVAVSSSSASASGSTDPSTLEPCPSARLKYFDIDLTKRLKEFRTVASLMGRSWKHRQTISHVMLHYVIMHHQKLTFSICSVNKSILSSLSSPASAMYIFSSIWHIVFRVTSAMLAEKATIGTFCAYLQCFDRRPWVSLTSYPLE